MGEYISAHIAFGGTLTRDQADQLVEALNAEGLGPDMDGGNTTIEELATPGLVFGSYEVNYGNIEEPIELALRFGLDYNYWYDSGPDWNACTTFSRGGETIEYYVGTGGEVLIPIRDIEQHGVAKILNDHARVTTPLTGIRIVG